MTQANIDTAPPRPTVAARHQLARYVPEPGHSLSDVFRVACELSAKAVGVERASVWLFTDPRRTAIRCVDLYELSKQEHSNGTILRVEDCPIYFESLDQCRTVPAEMARSDPRTAELGDAYLRPLGITSILDTAILREGEIFGILCLEQVGAAREWTTEDRDFSLAVADLIALKAKGAQLRELQAALRTQADRAAALDRAEALAHMASGIAHDVKNVFAAVQGHADLLGLRDDLPQDVTDSVREINAAVERGAALVREILEFARPKSRPPVAINLADATAELLPMLQATVGPAYPVRLERPAPGGQVLIDKTNFGRILVNLVVNARDATPGGGPIRIRVAPIKGKAGDRGSNHFVLVEVADQGTGMDEATKRKVFDPYFTTKAKGTGLGLAIVQQTVDRAGGSVRLVSEAGKGTVVRLFFPRISGGLTGTEEVAVPSSLFG